jgi:two-component system, sensor histidine kinase and response regulator
LRQAAADGDPFQAALLDLTLPEMDGEMLGQAIKADPALQATSLILITSTGRRGDAAKFQKIGFSGYLVKPVRATDVYESLAVVLAQTGVPGETPLLVTRHSLREMRKATRRILVVEDNPINRQVAKGMLDKIGYAADTAASARQGLLALEQYPYDLVLLDVQMPEMNGYEAAAKIRDPQSKVRNHAIPLVAVTGHASAEDRQACLQAGMNDYLTKPFHPQALGAILEKWLPLTPGGAVPDGVRQAEMSCAASNAQTATTIVDFERNGFISRLAGDVALAVKLARAFLFDAPDQIRRLERFLQAEDAEGLARQAHTLKGASANVGAGAMREAAIRIEGFAKAGDWAAIRSEMPGITARYDRLRIALEGFVHEQSERSEV